MWGVSSSSVDDRAAGRVEVCLEINNCGKLLSPLGPEGQKEELGCKSRDLQELQPRGNPPWVRGGRTAGGSWNREEDTGMQGVNPKHREQSRLGRQSHWCFPVVRFTPKLVGRGRDMQPAETGPCDRKQSGARAAVDLRPNEQMTRLMG